MPSWLLIVIVSIVELVLLVAIVGAVIIVVSIRNAKLKKELNAIKKEIINKQQTLNDDGVREIKIGG